jgi:hypothetical protein
MMEIVPGVQVAGGVAVQAFSATLASELLPNTPDV